MENGAFEDVFPIENGDFPWLCLFTGGYKASLNPGLPMKKPLGDSHQHVAIHWAQAPGPEMTITSPKPSYSGEPQISRRKLTRLNVGVFQRSDVPVDGSEILLKQLSLVPYPHYLQGFIHWHPRGLGGFLNHQQSHWVEWWFIVFWYSGIGGWGGWYYQLLTPPRV